MGFPGKLPSLGDHCVNSLLAKRKGTRSLSSIFVSSSTDTTLPHTQIIIIKRKFKEVCDEVPGSKLTL